ncbi:hypothetical protein BDV24DRAFT_142417, partial [Aspergillus arachidicola]
MGECERAAKHDFKYWREGVLAKNTEEKLFDRLERVEGQRDMMAHLGWKLLDGMGVWNARVEQAVAAGQTNTVGFSPVLRKANEQLDYAEAAERGVSQNAGSISV